MSNWIIPCVGAAAVQIIAACPGYLPSLGPAPLRFQITAATAPKITLPPLDMGNTTNRIAQASPSGTSPANIPVKPATANEIVGLLSPPDQNNLNPNLITAGAQTGTGGVLSVAPPDYAANPQITAQMLVPFFNSQGSTGLVNGIILTTNISFMPPTLGQPSSSSTYSTPNAQ